MDTSTGYLIIISIIAMIALVGMVGNIQLAGTYRRWLARLGDYESLTSFDTRKDRGDLIQNMVAEYKQHRLEGIEQVNTQAIIEKKVYEQQLAFFGIFRIPVGVAERLLQQLPSWAVIVGLLGTFSGLTIALFAMQETLLQLGTDMGDEVVNVSMIVSAIAQPFQGMSFAFITSIAGIGTSFLLHVLHSGLFARLGFGPSFQQLKNTFLTRAESFLDHQVQQAVQREKPKDSLEKIMDRLVDKVKESFAESIQDFGQQIIRMTGKIEQSISGLEAVIDQSVHFTAQFEKGTGQLTEFGRLLGNYIEKFERHEQQVAQQMAQLSKQIAALGQEFKQLTAKNEDSRQALSRVVERSDQIVGQIVHKHEDMFQFFQQHTEEIQRRFQDSMAEERRQYQQQQDEWSFRYQERNDQFSRAAESFGQAVQHLERQWEDGLERMKRELSSQMTHTVEQMLNQLLNQRQPSSNTDAELREVTRSIASIQHFLERELSHMHRYAQDMEQIMLGIYEGMRSQVAAARQYAAETREYGRDASPRSPEAYGAQDAHAAGEDSHAFERHDRQRVREGAPRPPVVREGGYEPR